jgi:hypothetical protein
LYYLVPTGTSPKLDIFEIQYNTIQYLIGHRILNLLGNHAITRDRIHNIML